MANNGSKLITRQVDNLREVASRARDLAESVSNVLQAATSQFYLEGETPIDFRMLQVVTGRWLDFLNDGLSTNQYQRQQLRNRNRHLREAVKTAARELRPILAQIRLQLDITLGKKATNSYFEGRDKIPRLSPAVLERVGSKLVNLLDDPKFGWDRLPEMARNLQSNLRDQLGVALENLRTAIDQLRPEQTALIHSDGNFRREYGNNSPQLRGVVDLLEGIYSAAGFLAEAASLAPSRIRRKPQEPEQQTPPKSAMPMAVAASAESGEMPGMESRPLSKSQRRRERRARRKAARGARV